MPISNQARTLYFAAHKAAMNARSILNGDFTASVKVEQDGSIHSVLTEADKKSQTYLLEVFRESFPGICFLCEEDEKDALGPDIINAGDISVFSDLDRLVAIIDPVDGTAGASRRLADWGVAANLFQGGRFHGGVVVAPEVRGGLTVVGDGNNGTFFVEGEKNFDAPRLAHVSACVDPKLAQVYLGVDTLKRKHFSEFVGVVANGTQTAHVAGSCALGTAFVAIGRSDAIFQPAQWPWDWATAPSLVLPAGGQVLYYHYRQGEPVRMAQPDLVAFNGDKSQRIGFIAGAPKIVDWLWFQLREHWKR